MSGRIGLFIVGPVVTALAFGSVVAWRLQQSRTTGAPPHVAIVFDRSASTSAANSCGEAVGLIDRVFNQVPAKRGSLLLFSVTGSAATANEPVELFRVGLPRARTVLEGRGSVLTERVELLAEVARRCRNVGTPRQSPIILAVRRTLETLRGLGCQEGSGCLLLVRTDGEETEDRVLLTKNSKSDFKLSNEGIRVTMCGFASVTSARNRLAAHRAISVGELETQWAGLFTRRELVTAEPICPSATSVTGSTRGGR